MEDKTPVGPVGDVGSVNKVLPEVRIGTSGWHYTHWRGQFYPPTLKSSEWLTYFAERFDTVEVNATFYRQVRPSTISTWLKATPERFMFSVKMHRGITHYQRLQAVDDALLRFQSIVDAFGSKLASVLIQLPPTLVYDPLVQQPFFDQLRNTFKRIPFVLEARHKSWNVESAFRFLDRHETSLCIADSGGRFPTMQHVVPPLVYIRLHGPGPLYASAYGDEALRQWSVKISQWRNAGWKVFVYFNNDFGGHALRNAEQLIHYVG